MTSSVKIEVIDLLRKTLIRSSLAIIIDINKENKVSVLAKKRDKRRIKDRSKSKRYSESESKSLIGSY